VKTLVS